MKQYPIQGRVTEIRNWIMSRAFQLAHENACKQSATGMWIEAANPHALVFRWTKYATLRVRQEISEDPWRKRSALQDLPTSEEADASGSAVSRAWQLLQVECTLAERPADRALRDAFLASGGKPKKMARILQKTPNSIGAGKTRLFNRLRSARKPTFAESLTAVMMSPRDALLDALHVVAETPFEKGLACLSNSFVAEGELAACVRSSIAQGALHPAESIGDNALHVFATGVNEAFVHTRPTESAKLRAFAEWDKVTLALYEDRKNSRLDVERSVSRYGVAMDRLLRAGLVTELPAILLVQAADCITAEDRVLAGLLLLTGVEKLRASSDSRGAAKVLEGVIDDPTDVVDCCICYCQQTSIRGSPYWSALGPGIAFALARERLAPQEAAVSLERGTEGSSPLAASADLGLFQEFLTELR